MKASFQQSDAAIEPFALIMSRERTPEVDAAIVALDSLGNDKELPSAQAMDMITGNIGSQTSVIPVSHITYFYAADKKVFARFGKSDWQVNLTLKVLDETLDATTFVRISNSAIVNLQALVRFDINLAGNYLAILRDGSSVKVSTRYIATIKSRLISRR